MEVPKPTVLSTGIRSASPSPSPAPTAQANPASQQPSQGSRDKTTLNRCLPDWQIAFITFCGVIGVTIFSTGGEVMTIAGPGGLLIAWAFVSVTAICVMEGLSEMIIMWPVSNAMVEYVKAFVDRDLAIVVGLAYWYTWSTIFFTLLIAASDFSEYWILHGTWRTIIFYVAIPFGLLIINCLGVKWYGYVEGFGGAVKLLFVLSGIIFMIVDASKVGSGNINDGVEYRPTEAPNRAVAVCLSIPILTYGFLGVEIVSVTAFEAKDRSSLRKPARFAAYGISSLYFVCTLLEAIVVYWKNPHLPSLQKRSAMQASTDNTWPNGQGFYAVIVIAARLYGSAKAGWYFNACIIYFCISASNTALYIASRTLFGLTREINRLEKPSWYLRVFAYFGTTSPFAQVPHWALVFSAFAFFWLPLLHSTSSDLLLIMSTTSSIGGVLVWASQCLAYIRYHHWFHDHKKRRILPAEYNRWNPQPDVYPWHRSRPFLASLQPVPAWIGLIGCLLVVFVFSTANWWNGKHITFTKVATAYAGPILLLFIFCALKLRNRRLWVRLDKTNTTLNNVTSNFERNSGIPLTAADGSRGMVMQTVGLSNELISYPARGGFEHGPEAADSV